MCKDTKSADIFALQETWLLRHDMPLLGTIDSNIAYTDNTAVDLSSGNLPGRAHGGVALLWLKYRFPCVSDIQCTSVRLVPIKVYINNSYMTVFSV